MRRCTESKNLDSLSLSKIILSGLSLGVLAGLLMSCGSAESDVGTNPRQVIEPTATDHGGGTTGTDTGSDTGGTTGTDTGHQLRSTNYFVPKNGSQNLSFPMDFAGFCSSTNPGTWTIEPANIPGVSLANVTACSVTVRVGNVNSLASVRIVGMLPIPNADDLEFRANIFLRLAPTVAAPQGFNFPVEMNSANAISSLAITNCNGDGNKMRLLKQNHSNGNTYVIFRDNCVSPNDRVTQRVFKLPVTVADPTPNGPGMSDFRYEFSCSTPIYNSGASCPLELSYNAQTKKVVMNFPGMRYSSANGVPAGTWWIGDYFYLSHPELFTYNFNTYNVINIYMKVSSPGGETNFINIAHFNIEIN